MYTLKVKGLDELRQAVKKSPDTTYKELSKAITTSVNFIRPIMRGEMPVGKTRKLSGNVQAQTDGLTGSVGPNLDITPYAVWVHRGTGLYGPFKSRIVPVRKKALYWPGARHPVKSTAGQVANPFVERTYNQIKNPVEQIFEKSVQRIVKSLAN